MVLQWTLKTFDELTVNELYKILQLRMEVFIVGQHCIFQDADDKDRSKTEDFGDIIKSHSSLADVCIFNFAL